jgi:epoxyqueuosine reductase QueG
VANSKHYLPGAQCAVIVCLTAPHALVNDPDLADPGLALQTYSLSGGLRETANKLVVQAGYDVTRELERYGFDAVGATAIKESEVVAAIPQVPPGQRLFTYTVLTNAELPETCFCCPSVESEREQGSYLKAALMEEAQRLGADVCGVSSVSRLQRVADAIRPFYAGESVIVARDTADLFVPYNPDVHTRRRNVRDPSTVLNGAKSVFVFGIALPQGTVDITARTASDSVGPYAFALYENLNYLRRVALRLVQWLDRFGIKAYVSDDLLDAGSVTASPRGEVPDLFSNRFEAFAAGLGRFAKAGYLVNEKYGTNVRYMAIVVDCELAEDDYAATAITACKQCDEPCIRTCATKAFAETVTFSVDQITESFYRLDTKRCDWAKRYCLVASEGCGYTGWTLDLPVPAAVTEEEVAQGVAQQPPIPKYRPCNFEACAMACPLQRKQSV